MARGWVRASAWSGTPSINSSFQAGETQRGAPRTRVAGVQVMYKPSGKVETWFGDDHAIPTTPQKSELLPEAHLRAAITSKGTISVVKIDSTQARAEGMGNERVAIAATIERPIFGRAALHFEMSRPGRYPGVSRGQRYVVAVSGSGELLGFVSVTGDLERTLEGHRKLVERLIVGR